MMNSLLRELDKERETSRKMLERVPIDKYTWKPHEKSMSLGDLATHVAEIPSWIPMVLGSPELDFAKNAYQPTKVSTSGELLDFFERSMKSGREELAKTSEEVLDETWVMRNGDDIYSTTTKGEALRDCFCQVVHHRAQLGVYLRLLNIAIPGSYGPSADDLAM